MSNSNTPTLAGFQSFITNTMQIPSAALPLTSNYVTYAFNVAMQIVNPVIAQASSLIYMLCVYNLAGSNLINFTLDQPGQTYFADLRKTLEINDFVPGVVNATSDQGTATTLLVPDFFKQLSLSDLQYLKDPYGRQYLAFAQRYGASIWGLS